MAFAEPLDLYFDTGIFADAGVLNGQPVSGIFEAGFDGAGLEGYGNTGSSPRYLMASASVPAHPEGKVLVISTGPAAGTYRVANAQPDGTGVTALLLIS